MMAKRGFLFFLFLILCGCALPNKKSQSQQKGFRSQEQSYRNSYDRERRIEAKEQKKFKKMQSLHEDLGLRESEREPDL